MTSKFRFLISVLCALLALSGGWLLASPAQLDNQILSRSSLTLPERMAVEDIDRYVQLIYGSSLFPNAQLREELQGLPDTADGLAEALADPSMSLLIKREDVWRIHLYDGYEGTRIRQIGDQLSDGWIIQEIHPTDVLLEKGDEQRRIEVFQAESEAE